MVASKHFTLGKEERLKSRKLIDRLFKEGKSFNLFPFRVLYIFPENATQPLQAGFVAGSRYFKKAVDRNRIKRLTKEAYRLQKNELEILLIASNQKLAVFFIYTGREIPDHAMVNEKMAALLQRLSNTLHEQHS